jgi:hypothetical protein
VGKLNKREALYPGKINVHIMDFISGLEKSDFLQGKTSYAGTSYLGYTVYTGYSGILTVVVKE